MGTFIKFLNEAQYNRQQIGQFLQSYDPRSSNVQNQWTGEMEREFAQALEAAKQKFITMANSNALVRQEWMKAKGWWDQNERNLMRWGDKLNPNIVVDGGKGAPTQVFDNGNRIKVSTDVLSLLRWNIIIKRAMDVIKANQPNPNELRNLMYKIGFFLHG